MSQPPPDFEAMDQPGTDDQAMHDPQEENEEEGEGDVVMPDASDDSSEEPEEDEDEERRIRDGFIVDEDEEEEEEDEDEERRKRRKRRKKHHRRRREEELLDLDEDDLELMEENTGTSFKKSRLTRLRRGGPDGDSPPSGSSKRRAVVESSDDDLDQDLPQVQDIQRIWDDGGRDDDDDGDIDAMDDFIDYDEEDEAGAPMDEEAREERRKERRKLEKERRRAQGIRPELAGIDANAWDEIHEVFGDGHEYDWALAADEQVAIFNDTKQEMKYQDVFEPSEIQARMLTEDDDLIRAQDIPERMQLANSTLSLYPTLSVHVGFTEADLEDAALWVTQRISDKKTELFFAPGGQHAHLRAALVKAVMYALRCLFIEEFEVPYVWTHRRDHISHFDEVDMRARFELLSSWELWRIYSLGQKYRALLTRKRALETSYLRLGVTDEYYETEIRPKTDSVEVVADVTEWMSMKYKEKKNGGFEFHFHDDQDQDGAPKRKMPTRISAYEVAKKSLVSKLAQGFGIQPHQVVLNYMVARHAHFIDDEELNPTVYAEQFIDPDPSKAETAEELLRRARMIFATELGKDPLLRRAMREAFQAEARVSVSPTERGVNKIDEYHMYYNFKYLYQKRISDMLKSFQFLHMLKAEEQHLITISVTLPSDIKLAFERRLEDAFTSDGFSDTAKAWNAERTRIVREVIDQHLLPAAVKWTREYIREEVEEYLARQCGEALRARVNVAPFRSPEMKVGETPSVLAVSWGKGDPQKDAISMVYLDQAGRMREYTKIDNLMDEESNDEFVDLIKRRQPDVIVVGGFSMATSKLSLRVKEKVNPGQTALPDEPQPPPGENLNIPVIYVYDDVARIYQHSHRADEEYPSLSQTAKYCVGLARYAQSPLNEFAAMGRDIVAIKFHEDQHLVTQEKQLVTFERVLVDVVNNVGVDINRAVTDSYIQLLLPFVCGLGPRKAQVVVKKIASLGGNLVNREQFIKAGILTTKIFLNASAFLRIPNELDLKPYKNRNNDDDTPDPLDNTRIHPEDYELARKMATDALELDEEDVHDEHPSHVIGVIMQDADNEKKLADLNLDEFAVSLYEANGDLKRHTLNVIRDELRAPFAEQRPPFVHPEPWEVLTMLSGETERSLRVGLIVVAMVGRLEKEKAHVRLDSGIEGVITAQWAADPPPRHTRDVFKQQTPVNAVIIAIKADPERDIFYVELTARPGDLEPGDSSFRMIQHDPSWDDVRAMKDKEMLQRKKRAEVDRTRRVIKHPNFHNFNSSQAEAFLDKQQRGDVVVRPSSKGNHHLAVTWKVDDKLYQHIDVTEINPDPTGQTLSGQLMVDSKHTYADLDELIVNHVQAMARKVEELMAHDRFKAGTEDELHLFLKNYLAANPAKSMYGFTLNRKKPGHFNLCFLANKKSAVQSWPVRVTPQAYYLFEAPAPGVPELLRPFCRHLHESQNAANQAAGGKTPYLAGTRTPAHLGRATPGHSVRQPARTPNPYGGATPYGGGAPPPRPGPNQFGYQTPSYTPQPPPTALPAGMNPERAAMIQNSGGWSSNNGGGW
ncbi:Transcription elongation factor spt6 [Pleurotus pulmonarius]|nr:Transcription elongation factor spt6 [Pleurotus pulmonarius]